MQTENTVLKGPAERSSEKKSVNSSKKKHHKKTLHSKPEEVAGEQRMAPLQTSSDKQKTAQSSDNENLVLKGTVCAVVTASKENLQQVETWS